MREEIIAVLDSELEKFEKIEKIRDILHDHSQLKSQPVDRVKWVDINKVVANEYNPNSVARTEMGLLYVSIKNDGYTQPVVTVYDEEKDQYIIVDGFHRYYVCKTNKDIYEQNNGMLPVTVINKNINDRMASTIRHNRARGKHSIQGMSSIVFKMLNNGWSDGEICNELGMEPEELARLKHITGFSKLYKDAKYRQAWVKNRQIRIQQIYKDNPELSAKQINSIMLQADRDKREQERLQHLERKQAKKK